MAFIEEWRSLTKSDPIIYASPGFYPSLVNRIKEMDAWMALYNRYLTAEEAVAYARKKGWRGRIRMWQYTDDGDIDADGDADGIALGMETAKLDLNVFLGSVEEFSAWAGKTPPVVCPPNEDEEPSAPVPDQPGQMAVVCGSGLNIRKGAGTNYGIWATAPKGTLLDVLEIKGDWVRVGWKQWCMARLDGDDYLE